jgi:hypothetical protein
MQGDDREIGASSFFLWWQTLLEVAQSQAYQAEPHPAEARFIAVELEAYMVGLQQPPVRFATVVFFRRQGLEK